MILAPNETARYFRAWWPLLKYVNDHLHVVENVPPYPGARANFDEAMKLRDALWNHDSLRKQFLAENPAGLPPEDLALVESWSGRISGQFYLYRHLQKHSIVLPAGSAKRAYGVLALTDPLNQLIQQPLPVLLGLVLLPFEDHVIYDGLLSVYRITFGGGIRSELDAHYRAARERGAVLTSLLPDAGWEASASRLRAGNALVLKEFRKDLASAGLSEKKLREHVDNVEALAEALLQGSDPRPLLELDAEDVLASLALRGAGSRVSFKRLARFLEQSERIQWGTLQGMAELR